MDEGGGGGGGEMGSWFPGAGLRGALSNWLPVRVISVVYRHNVFSHNLLSSRWDLVQGRFFWRDHGKWGVFWPARDSVWPQVGPGSGHPYYGAKWEQTYGCGMFGDDNHTSNVDRCTDNVDGVIVNWDFWKVVKSKKKGTTLILVKGRPEDLQLCVRNSFFIFK